MGYRSISPSINVNTTSGQLRTELLNTFNRLDGQLSLAPYRLATQNGPVLTVGTSETTLFTTGIDFNTLSKLGTSLLIFACGTTGANANNKTIKMYFGGTEIFNTGAFAGNNISWTLQGEVVRNGGAAQICWTQFMGSATLTSAVNVVNTTVSLTTQQELKITGTGTASGDVSGSYWKVLLLT